MALYMKKAPEYSQLNSALCVIGTFGALAISHYPLLRLPYYWDEAGYYIPAALDFFRHGLLVPQSTLPTGHTPLLPACLALAWQLLGFAPLISRLTMIAFASGTLVALYNLGRAVARREIAIWACILLAVSPLFFAQSSLVFLDLPAAFTTTVAVWALLRRHMAWFAVASSLAVLTKETAVVIVPVALIFVWRFRKDLRKSEGLWMAAPVFLLGAWATWYHHMTGFWTGNPQYLQYNLYSTFEPGRIAVSLLRRLYQVFIGGFNWLIVVAALLGYRRMKKTRDGGTGGDAMAESASGSMVSKEFFFLAGVLAAAYIVMLSTVGGAVLPRYLLPMFPCFYLALAMLVDAFPRPAMRVALLLVAACFVASWFINPPYPFAYEDNLSYADFIRLHQQAAEWLSAQPGNPRILTAWPVTDELVHTELGYVKKPLRVVGLPGFKSRDFNEVSAKSFDLLYIYSRKWDPPDNWLRHYRPLARADEFSPPVRPAFVALRFDLHLVAFFHLRGQWVRIYAKAQDPHPASPRNL
jgi:4-amino-4-deoxy-L-arabinose transferase-like glycosyltransferase